LTRAGQVFFLSGHYVFSGHFDKLIFLDAGPCRSDRDRSLGLCNLDRGDAHTARGRRNENKLILLQSAIFHQCAIRCEVLHPYCRAFGRGQCGWTLA
jgi:hypothetical protein